LPVRRVSINAAWTCSHAEASATADLPASATSVMTETRKLAAILVADVVGYSRLAGADEDRILARLRTLRSDLIDPTIAVHHGHIIKRTGDGSVIEFRSVVDAVRCAIEVQTGMIERNAGVPPERRIEFRVGIHLGDVVEESDGDLMGDGVNIAARLERISEPGGICLSSAAYEQVRDRVREEFADVGERRFKNIARPVKVYALKQVSEGLASGSFASAQNKLGPPHSSIVVLPFANMTGDPEQERFVEGVTESLAADLSRSTDFFVIGRSTALTYKGKHVDLRQVGRELNVRYVLEGSVQRSGDWIRIISQLNDAETGSHLWTDRFDKPLGDPFVMQNEIVARLANALATQLTAADARRAGRDPNPISTDLVMQGFALIDKGVSLDSFAGARRLFERVLATAPGDAWALVGIAMADVNVALSFYPDDRAARLGAAETALTKALSIAPKNGVAHMCMGIVLIHTNRGQQGIRECERALELNRNLAIAHATIGLGKIQLGRAGETEAHVKEALRLSPRDVAAYLFFLYAGLAKLWLGENEEAVGWLRRSIEANRNNPMSHFLLASALALLGRLSEARSEINTGLLINPTFTIARIRAAPWIDNPAFDVGRERLIDGMRKAGVPEQ
jgi:TolB-like protein/class 3 adenylate cyclase/tetratricopeptide (TPR) repeat protein